MQYYYHNCENYPLYLSSVPDLDSPNFDKTCCPYCGSVEVQEYEFEDD
jgi:hypothetical protein